MPDQETPRTHSLDRAPIEDVRPIRIRAGWELGEAAQLDDQRGEMAPPASASSRSERRSPVDLPDGPSDHARPLAWTSAIITLAAAYLLVTNAFSIDGWVAEQPPSAAMLHVGDASAAWLAGTGAIGLAAPRATLHHAWKDAEIARFPGQPTAEEP